MVASAQNPLAREFSETKMRDAICFFVDKGGPSLGKTKLMKLLYYSDFGFFAEHGRAVTNDTYVKFPLGPVPKHASKLLRKMTDEGKLIPDLQAKGVYMQESFRVNCEHGESLDQDERAKLETVWERWGSVSRNAIVLASHDDLPWRSVSMGEDIPYELAYYM